MADYTHCVNSAQLTIWQPPIQRRDLYRRRPMQGNGLVFTHQHPLPRAVTATSDHVTVAASALRLRRLEKSMKAISVKVSIRIDVAQCLRALALLLLTL